MLHSGNSVGTLVSGFHCARRCFAHIIFSLWMPRFIVGGAWHKRIYPWVYAEWQLLCELQFQFPEAGTEYTQKLLAGKCITPAWICMYFQWQAKYDGRRHGKSKRVSIVQKSVLQHYVELYVCSVPLAPGHLKISCTVNFVRCSG
jgi:hypothetical protein